MDMRKLFEWARGEHGAGRTAQTRSMNFQQLPTISIDDIAIFDDEHNTDMCAGYLNKKASKQRLIEIGFISSSLFVMCITWK